MIDAKKLAVALAKIANDEVPLGRNGEMIQSVQQYAFEVLDEMGVEVDAFQIESEWA